MKTFTYSFSTTSLYMPEVIQIGLIPDVFREPGIVPAKVPWRCWAVVHDDRRKGLVPADVNGHCYPPHWTCSGEPALSAEPLVGSKKVPNVLWSMDFH